jgi:type I restriction enzyme S subunit
MSAELNWPEVSLEQVADEVTVGFVGSMANEYRSFGIPFFRSLNIKPLRIETEELKFISPEFHQRIRKSRLNPGDVVIVRTGDPGTATVISDSFTEANCSDLVIVRPSKRLNPHFLAYYVNAVAHHQVAAEVVGAVQQHFNVGSAKRLKITLPPRPEQDAIAKLLRVYDRKLDLNRRMNRTLKELAIALFRSWFVDFDLVVAKAAGRKPAHLRPELAALFPATFQDSPLGPIPHGWRVGGISDISTIAGGGTPKTSVAEYWNGDIPWFSVVDTPPTGQVFVLETEKTITQRGLDESAAQLLPEGTTIITARGTVGNLALVGNPMAINQSCYAMIPKSGFSPASVFFAMQNAVEDLQRMAHGSVFDTITRTTLDSLSFTIGTQEILSAFENIVSPWLAQIKHNLCESRTLSALRDTLLPKLLSGELRVKSAEKLVEAKI